MVFRLRGCVWGYFVSSCVFFFWVFLGMCLVDGSLAKRVAKALIPLDALLSPQMKNKEEISSRRGRMEEKKQKPVYKYKQHNDRLSLLG